jgi:hypothetical protein
MLCAAHSPKRQHSLQPLFALLERAPAADEAIDELQFIDDELRMLVDIRRVALNWLTEGPTDATGDAGPRRRSRRSNSCAVGGPGRPHDAALAGAPAAAPA